jgi:SAM-dependent methyltransferase|tara:strand:- start:3239 stop:4021 length:783 start_codon:yes stop_codon:yes gene_type:complete
LGSPVLKNCYDFPVYWDIAFRDETKSECRFVTAVSERYLSGNAQRILDIGCGGGRLTVALAARGYEVAAYDLNESCIAYVQKRLRRRGLDADVVVGDMREFVTTPKCDIAINTVSTFRHLLSDNDALFHLECTAQSVRRGGIYILGLHLLPPDADLDDEEHWVARHSRTTVDVTMKVRNASRKSRLETLRFTLKVQSVNNHLAIESDFKMRLYSAAQLKSLLAKSDDWELVDVFDYWYDIEQPLVLNDELGDTVCVLRRK